MVRGEPKIYFKPIKSAFGEMEAGDERYQAERNYCPRAEAAAGPTPPSARAALVARRGCLSGANDRVSSADKSDTALWGEAGGTRGGGGRGGAAAVALDPYRRIAAKTGSPHQRARRPSCLHLPRNATARSPGTAGVAVGDG